MMRERVEEKERSREKKEKETERERVEEREKNGGESETSSSLLESDSSWIYLPSRFFSSRYYLLSFFEFCSFSSSFLLFPLMIHSPFSLIILFSFFSVSSLSFFCPFLFLFSSVSSSIPGDDFFFLSLLSPEEMTGMIH